MQTYIIYVFDILISMLYNKIKRGILDILLCKMRKGDVYFDSRRSDKVF